MKNNKLLLPLVLLATTACIKKTPETLISRWEKKTESVDSSMRRLASSQNGKCLDDKFRVEELKKEIINLEKPYVGARKVIGSWKHLDLSELPVPQANFLKTYGKQIGDLRNPESISYAGCEDVPCIYNKIYNKENHVAGYVHYIWYLKFKHMLSADNIVPNQTSKNAGEYNNKAIPLSNYLYNDNELYALWRLSHMLKAPHTNLKNLKEIQRIPRGEKFESDDYKRACGIAHSSGWIEVTDECLTVNEWNKDTGYLYLAVTHELTHHVDFEQGRGSKLFYRSHRDDYLNIAGLYLNEFVDEEGKTVRKWEQKPGTKLVTDYAGRAPQENFAESIAYFRVDGDLTKSKITEEHFHFVSNDYFDKRSFEKEQLIKTWIEEQSPEIGSKVLEAVVECNNNATTPKTVFFKNDDFSTVLYPGMLNCLSYKGQEISQSVQEDLVVEKPDGCLAFNDENVKVKWDARMKGYLTMAFSNHLQKLESDPKYVAKIQDFYSRVKDISLAQTSYIACYKEPNEESCFKREIQKNAYDHALELNLLEAQTKEMAELYISQHTFDNTKEKTLNSYHKFVSSNLDSIRKEARIVWNGCLNIVQNDEQSPSGSLFHIGTDYMISSFYNCLNLSIPDAVKMTVRSLSIEGLKVEHAKEEIILMDEVRPNLISILKDIYLKEKEAEIKVAATLVRNDDGKLRSRLMSDFSWVKSAVDSGQIMSDCKQEAIKLINFTSLYNQKQELFGEYLEKKSCAGISTSSEFSKWMESSQKLFQEKIIKGLENKLFEFANLKADDCLRVYPADTAINKLKFKTQREACLMNEWPKFEKQVLSNAMRDPTALRFKMSAEDLKGKIESNRRIIQLRVMKTKFN